MPSDIVTLSSILSIERLRLAVESGYVAIRAHADGHTHLLNYTDRAQFDEAWTPEVLACRGLVVSEHPFDERALVLARPFAKFANASQHAPGSSFGPLPTGAIEVLEKIDGSMVVAFDAGHGPEFATRGCFSSAQSVATTRLWRERYADYELPPGITMVFEYVAPTNRIVVEYPREDLVLLAALDVATGADVDVTWPGPRAQRIEDLRTMDDVARYVRDHDTSDAEGFVVRFLPPHEGEPSVRVKVKYAEYLRVHRLVTGVSSLTIWEMLSAGESFDEIISRVPDEFYEFVRHQREKLTRGHDELVSAAHHLAEQVRALPRAQAAAIIVAQKDVLPGLVFADLDHKDVSAIAWKNVRPVFELPSQPLTAGQ